MKKIILFAQFLFTVVIAVNAQTITDQSKKDKVNGGTATTVPAAAPSPVSVNETVQIPDSVHPSYEKRLHAEQRSNGHAFSGKGKGGEKNIIDPGEKIESNKSEKIPATEENTQNKKDKMKKEKVQ